MITAELQCATERCACLGVDGPLKSGTILTFGDGVEGCIVELRSVQGAGFRAVVEFGTSNASSTLPGAPPQ